MTRVILAPVRLFIQTVLLALGQVWVNKVRAFLTALGIIIGTGSVIGVIGGLTGMEKFVLNTFDSAIGVRRVVIWGQVPRELRSVMSWEDAKITEAEADLLIANSETIDVLTPVCNQSLPVGYRRESRSGVSVIGVRPAWHETEDRTTILGRPIRQSDIDEKLPICLINEEAIEELRLPRDPVGENLTVDGRRFLIVGVLETKDVPEGFGGGEARTELIIPFSTSKSMNPYTSTRLDAMITSPDVAEEAKAEITAILRAARNLRGEDEDTFGMWVAQNEIGNFNAVAGVIGFIAVAVVSISLLVGGIGIMNIMLVSVSERTREIGLRKAVGAKGAVVLLQFLVEAIVLCLVGGGIGLAIGFGLVEVFRNAFDLEFASVPTWAIILSLASAASVGVIAGMFPAIKAARLDPINALRHE
ncbi:MAG: ABC transporter permease [Planctomycetota bacterium]